MAEPHVISALRGKRAELSGEVLVAQARIDKLRLDLAAVDRAISLFDPSVRSSDIVPIVRRGRRETRFRHGAWTATVLDTLRNADGPLTVREIAQAVAEKFSAPYDNPVDIAALDGRVRTCLKRPGRGVVSEWSGNVTTWRLAPDTGDVVE